MKEPGRRKDLFAGLALTAVMIPAGMEYAEAAHLPAIAGLYASIAALVPVIGSLPQGLAVPREPVVSLAELRALLPLPAGACPRVPSRNEFSSSPIGMPWWVVSAWSSIETTLPTVSEPNTLGWGDGRSFTARS